jgi:hypothetical protein
VSPKGFSSWLNLAALRQHARYDSRAQPCELYLTIFGNQLILFYILDAAMDESDPGQITEFLRQWTISLLYWQRSGETPLQQSKSVSFEV